MAALSLRYDHYSSQSMFEAACKRANLGDLEHYTASDVAAFRAALATLGDRLQRVDDRLDSLLGERPAQAPQATAPMPAPASADSTPPAASSLPAQAPQATMPMPATETTKPEAAKPLTETSKAPEPAKPAQVTRQAPQAATPLAAPSTEAAETRIVLSGVELAGGDALFVCGDSSSLGNWDPERARPMMRDGDDWIAVVPRGEGSFKFLRRTEDGDVTWESGENRELGAAVQIETSWQSRSS